jgi:hypothetical protein
MKKLMIGLVAAALLPMAAPVTAKNICVNVFGSTTPLKLVGVKPLKKPGSVSPLTGIYREGSIVGPITGSAMTNMDGTISLSFTWHIAKTTFDRDIIYSAVVPDSTFLGGDWSYDNTGDHQIDGGGVSATALNCKDFTLPPSVI